MNTEEIAKELIHDFSREEVKSMRLRLILLSGGFLFSFMVFLVMVKLFPLSLPPEIFLVAGGLPVYVWLLSALVILFSYEIILWGMLGNYIKHGKTIPVYLRYAHAFLESSTPTIFILISLKIYNPVYALFILASMLYFIFIILSALSLDFKLSLFQGAVSAIEYAILALIVVHGNNDSTINPLLLSNGHHIGRAILFLLGGLATAFVAHQIKIRVTDTFRSLQEKNRIYDLFGQHVSPEVVEKLLAQKDLASENRHVCMMFLDIRDFTKFSDKNEPDSVVEYLNRLFDFMIDIVNANRGIINKFLGDGFMAVFGAPLSDGRDSRNAVTAALEIVSRVKSEADAGNIPATRIGIGLHAGEAVTGNVGSARRKEYTIIGGTVNLASRIEQLNKKFGSQILASESVIASVPDIPAERIGRVSVKGVEEPVTIYRFA